MGLPLKSESSAWSLVSAPGLGHPHPRGQDSPSCFVLITALSTPSCWVSVACA